jgi:hypothetical protein
VAAASSGGTSTDPDEEASDVDASGNAEEPVAVAPGLWLVSLEQAEAATLRVMRKPVGQSLSKAPVVKSTAGQAVALTVRGLEPDATYLMRVKVKGVYADVAEVTVDEDGLATPPVVSLTRAGTYPVAFVSDDPDVDTRYVKLAVGPRTATP